MHSSLVQGSAAKSSKLSDEEDDVCASSTDVITLRITSTYVIDIRNVTDVTDMIDVINISNIINIVDNRCYSRLFITDA